MNTLHVKKGDTVIVLSGEEKGKTGAVTRTLPQEGLVFVEGIGAYKKHQKPRRSGQKGQIIDKHAPLAASKVMTVEAHKARAKKHKK